MRSSIRTLKRSLMLKLLVLLVILAGLLFYSNRTAISVILDGRQATEIINATGRQRMLVQQFVRQANLALVGLSLSDWDTLLEQRKLSAETSAQFDESMHALLEGGQTRLGASTVTLPRIEATDIRAGLMEISALWDEVKRISVKVLRSDQNQLRDHPDLARLQSTAIRLVAKVDDTLQLMQLRELQRSSQLIFYQNSLLLGGLLVFALLAAFVYRSIVNPLAETIEKLDQSEIQLRNLYDAAPVGLWQANLADGQLLKTNSLMARHLQCTGDCDEGCDSEKSLYSLLPGNAVVFKSALEREGEVTDFETCVPEADGSKRTLLISARHYPDKGLGEGAVIDITARKRTEAELAAVHKQLIQTSHQAGMAEVAASVLHNVGNVLNSLNTSSTLIATQIQKSKVASLPRIARVIKDKGNDVGEYLNHDPKGKQLPDFLCQLADHLVKDQATQLKEMELLQENIEHIKEIVAMQQSYAKISGVVETVVIADLIEDSLRLNLGALQRHGVEVRREFEEVPPVDVEKHKILQVLVNLVRNAKYACDESGRSDKIMTIRLAKAENRLRISILDNGVGIPQENMTLIFSHGFTTRKDGHGFGLHSAVLAATEMGGSLTAQSDGPGKGACFTLEVPFTPHRIPSSDPASKACMELVETRNHNHIAAI
ncbi:hypothetical protein DB346_10480 [Verrucomicrobia bacterium LW23]|nr:hypothetical protein DB346_10480 [Verrucomicrobia bacterium LW23]